MRGFTLIEGLVACFILSTVMMAAIGLYPSSVLATIEASNRTTASGVASMALEDARMQDFNAIPLGKTTLPDQTLDGTVYHALLEVEAPAADVKRIQVTVQWSDRLPGSVTYETAVFNYRGGQL
jgi:Tfp pilus assembly protein PilV